MTLTIDLSGDDANALSARAKAGGVSLENCAEELLSKALSPAAARPPLAERIRDIWADIPDTVRAKLPADGASQHDHYIYGVSKREL